MKLIITPELVAELREWTRRNKLARRACGRFLKRISERCGFCRAAGRAKKRRAA